MTRRTTRNQSWNSSDGVDSADPARALYIWQERPAAPTAIRVRLKANLS